MGASDRLQVARIAGIVALCATHAARSFGQEPVREIVLGPPTVYAQEFTMLTSVRELSDGSVLAIDGCENVLRLLTSVSGPARLVGSRGQGPAEYQSIWGSVLIPLRGDSTLLIDAQTSKMLVIVGGSMTGSFPFDRNAHAGMLPRGSDTLGHLLLARTLPDSQPPNVRTFTGTVYRTASALVGVMATAGGRIDTLGKIPQGGSTLITDDLAGFRRLSEVTNFLNPKAAAVMSPDGWLAIAYPDPYHVEWRSPAGQLTVGPALDRPRPVRDQVKQAAFAASQIDLGPETPQGTWPAAVPAFALNGEFRHQAPMLLPTPEGNLLIQRTYLAGMSSRVRYDVVGRDGKLVAAVLLPTDQRILGFGRGTVYTRTENADGIQHLQRHAWPLAHQ